MKFKNYIEAQSGIKDSADSSGTLDQVLTSTATGVAWVDPSTISAEAATLVAIECKNTSGATITKGTPVYQTGTVGATDVIEIAPADALISSGKQPAIGLLQTTLNNNGFGKVVITGELLNFTTDPIDGVTPTTGQKVFLKSGGGLTLTKPTGEENGIQNLGLIGKVSGGNAGSITVSSIMRTNDVPNLTTGKIWVGSDANTIESATVHLDETNGRLGIGTTSPNTLIDVSSVNTGATAPTVRITNTRESGNWGDFTDDLGRFEFFTDDVSANAPYTLGYIGIKNDRTGSGTLPSGAMVLATTTYNAVDGAVERMRITSDGDVGIGTTSPSYKLDITGEGRFTGDVRGLSFITTSQRDQKEGITDITKTKAKTIPFKEYTYKSSIDGSARKRYGVIAEDIENDYPELVHTGADGVKGINYIDLLVKRVAELEKELEDISLTPGAAGPQGPSGSNGNDGNSHLSNVDSITFDGKANQLVLTINRTDFRFSPVK